MLKIIVFKLKDNVADLLVDNYENIVKCIKENSITEKLAEDFIEIQDVQEEQKVFEKVSKDSDGKSQVFDVEVDNNKLFFQWGEEEFYALVAVLIIVMAGLFVNKLFKERFFLNIII